MLCYLRALLFKNSWYHYVILQRWGLTRDGCHSWAAKKLDSDAIFPKFWRTTSVPVHPVSPREGRNMRGRKILRAAHFSALHNAAGTHGDVTPARAVWYRACRYGGHGEIRGRFVGQDASRP